MQALLLCLALASTAPAALEPSSTTLAAAQDVESIPLAQALEELEAHNPDLEALRAALDDAEAVAKSSLSALLPVVTLTGNYTLNNEEAVLDMGELLGGLGAAVEQATGQPLDLGGGGGTTTIQPRQSVTGGLRVQVPLFAANAYADIKAARASIAAREADRRAAEVQLRGGLRQAAWLAGAAESFVAVAERAVGNAAAHADRTQRLMDAGRATRLARDQAKLQLLQRRHDLLTAQNELAKAQLAMGIMLGREGPVRVVLPEVEAVIDVPAAGPAVEEALLRRPELTARRAEQDAARLRVRSAKMRYLPTLNASLGGNASTAEYVTGLNYAWQAGLALQWHLYAAGSRKAGKRRAEAGLRAARASLRRETLQVRQETLDAHRELTAAHAQYALATEEVKVATEAAASAERTYEEGHATSLEVIDALDASFRAELRLEQNRARVAAAAAKLDAAIGER